MAKTKALELLEKIPFKLDERQFLPLSEAIGLNKAEEEAFINYWKLIKQGGKKAKTADADPKDKHLTPPASLPPKAARRINRRLPEILDQLILLNQPKGFNFWESFQLLKLYKEYGAEKNFGMGLKQLYKSVQGPGNYDNDHYLHLFMLKETEISLQRGVRKKREDVGILESDLDAFYLENKIRLLCEKRNRGNVYNNPGDETPFEASIRQNGYKLGTIGAQMYYAIYQMLANKDDKTYYLQTLELFDKYAKRFTSTYCLAIRTYLMNQCIYYFNRGDLEFAAEYLKHIDKLLGNKTFFIKEVLTPASYKNITTAGLAIGRVDWLEKFIQRYTRYLPEDSQSVALKYNLAQIRFSKGDLDGVYPLLVGLSNIDVFYRVGIERLFLKTYYESGEFKVIENKIPTFKKYVQRNRSINQQSKLMLLNFIKYLQRLMKGEKINVSDPDSGLSVTDLLWFKKVGGLAATNPPR